MKKDDKRGSFYWVGETPYVSVTKVLSIIDKSTQLMWWACGETYDACLLDPTIERAAAINAHNVVSNKAKERGSSVHSIIESYKVTGSVAGLDGMYQGYANAFKTWLGEHKLNVLENEKTVVSKKYGYAGTLDMLVEVDGVKCILDIKTNKDGNLYDEVGLQLSAYQQALKEEGTEVQGLRALGLAENGTFTYKSYEPNLMPFLACKEVYEWKNKDYLIKVKANLQDSLFGKEE